jgi:putative phosphoserine phosphatase/1-acylglycerol-3-phosphate O-acyltransferase
MGVHTALTREIDEGPSGPEIGAFFDLDRTLLAGYSASAFVRDDFAHGYMSVRSVIDTLAAATRFQIGHIGFSGFVTRTVARLRGRAEDEFATTAEGIFRERLASAIYPESRALVEAHQRKGHTIAIVSSATRYQIEPLARDFGVRHVLCTELEVRKGRFTGEIIHPSCYGEGKAVAARGLARTKGLDLARSYFYTDSHEDLPLLEIVGYPRPTNANSTLAEIAAKRGWPVKHFSSRGTPGVLEIVRTSLAVGSLIPSVLLGVPAGLLSGSWQRAINVIISTWGELGTALAKVDLRVTGEDNLWKTRPAVFIFNHQSGIDMLLLCRLLRRDIVGIAKEEVRRNPLFGPVMAMTGTVFIDRFHHDRAVAAMQPAVETLRHGISIVIAPEGTRSPTPRLGRFKKGAFHLAMAAQVPIVPIVFKNALDALPKHGVVVHPANVEVVVHPPVSTVGWTAADLDREIEAMQRLYDETLRA